MKDFMKDVVGSMTVASIVIIIALLGWSVTRFILNGYEWTPAHRSVEVLLGIVMSWLIIVAIYHLIKQLFKKDNDGRYNNK